MLIPFALGGVFIAACLIWALTWSIQIGGSIIAILFRAVVALISPVLVLLGALGWMLWFCVAPRPAMASLRKAQAAQKRTAHG